MREPTHGTRTHGFSDSSAVDLERFDAREMEEVSTAECGDFSIGWMFLGERVCAYGAVVVGRETGEDGVPIGGCVGVGKIFFNEEDVFVVGGFVRDNAFEVLFRAR